MKFKKIIQTMLLIHRLQLTLFTGSQGLDDMKKSGFWTSVSDQLLMFPLNPSVRVVLLEMLCVGTQPYQVCPRNQDFGSPIPLNPATPL